MKSEFQHKDKKIIIPAGVEVCQLNDKIVALKGRYFYGHETKSHIILQPEPFVMSPRMGMWHLFAGFACGTFFSSVLHWVFK